MVNVDVIRDDTIACYSKVERGSKSGEKKYIKSKLTFICDFFMLES